MPRDVTTIEARHIGIGTFRTTNRMRELVQQVLDSNRISYGPVSRAFEARFAELHRVDFATLSNSGTSSLQVALQAMKELHGWADGDEVIVPATTFVATPNIVLHNRMTPVFVDVRPDTFNIDYEMIEAVIGPRTRAIIPVHLFGQAANMAAISEIAGDNSLLVIEDSCETMFATHHDIPVGGWGEIGCFSLYMAHLLTAGVGGVATTDNPDYAAKMRSLVNHGLEIEELAPDARFGPRHMLGRRFKFDSIGHSFRITEIEAAIALAQCDNPMYDIVKPRRRNAKHIAAGLRILHKAYGRWMTYSKTARGNTHSWMMFPIMVSPDAPFTRDEATAYLNERNIETRDMLPILGQPIYDYLDPREFPVSQSIVEQGFYVGCHQHLEPEDIQYLVQEIGYLHDDYNPA